MTGQRITITDHLTLKRIKVHISDCAVAQNGVGYAKHAQSRMVERDIMARTVLNVLRFGDVIHAELITQNHEYRVELRFFEDERLITVIGAIQSDFKGRVFIITAINSEGE